MQTTSAIWKALWASGEAMLETRAIIADVAYTQMTSPIISRALTQDGLSIGNAVAASCQFAVLADSAAVPKAAPVRIEMRLRDGDTMSEWLPAGTFYISHRGYDPVSGVLTLECFDALLRANADAPNGSGIWVTDQGVEIVTNAGENIVFGFDYPQSAGDMVAKIATLLGVTPDPRNAIASGTIETPANGTTLQDILKKIGTLNGGNWIITPANQLRLVPVVSAANADSASSNVVDLRGITQGISARSVRTITGVRYTDPEAGTAQVIGTEQGLVLSAGEVTAAQAQAIYTRLQGMTYQAYALSGAIYDPAAELGDYVRGGANDEIRSVLYSETAVFSELYHADISAPESGELADEYPYLGATAKALNEAKNFAEEAASEAEEAAKSYADDAVSGLNADLDQTAIFNRLTDNGRAQGIFLDESTGDIYFNATYIKTGTLDAGIIGANTIAISKLTREAQGELMSGTSSKLQYYLSTSITSATGGTWQDTVPYWTSGKYIWTRTATTVTMADGTSSTSYSDAVYDQNTTNALSRANSASTREQWIYRSAISGTATMAANYTWVTNAANAQNVWTTTRPTYSASYPVLFVAIQRQTVQQSGGTTCSCTTPVIDQTTTVIDGGHITTGAIDAGIITAGVLTGGNGVTTLDLVSGNLNASNATISGAFTTYSANGEYTQLRNGYIAFWSPNQNPNGAPINIGRILSSYNSSDDAYEMYVSAYSNGKKSRVWLNAGLTRVELISNGGITADTNSSGAFAVTGDFTVSGTKSRKVATDQYADRLLYCYETASPMFGDVGEGRIGEDGRCYIWLDALFAQTIADGTYQVFLQRYGVGDCYVAERRPGYFVVTGEPGLAFGWEIKARQRGYEQTRLSNAANSFAVQSKTYGEDAAKYLDDLRRERELI